MIEISTEEFKEKLQTEKLLLLDVQTEWCGGCKQLKPTLEILSNELDNINIYSLDADKNQEYALSLGIRSIPVVIVFKNGEEVERVMGSNPKSKYRKIIEKYND
jgi:thioredoxin